MDAGIEKETNTFCANAQSLEYQNLRDQIFTLSELLQNTVAKFSQRNSPRVLELPI